MKKNLEKIYFIESTINAAKAKHMENDSAISFHVKDEGIGIDKKYLPRVFDRFFKVPGQKGGTGLGLAISKEFIEAMGESIYANSELGKGSTFSFQLKKT